MKKLLPIIAVAMLLSACQTPTNPARISGTIEAGKVEAHLNGAPPMLSDGWSNPTNPNDIPIEVADDGSFEISVPLEEAAFYRLAAGETTVEMFLQPGDESRVRFGDEVSFEGSGADLNQFIQTLDSRLTEVQQQINRQAVEIFNADLAGFQAAVHPLRDELLEEHAKFVAAKGDLPASFVERTRDDIVFWFKDLDMNYPRIHHSFTGREAEIPAGYVAEVAKDGLDRTASMTSRPYVYFLDAYIRLQSYGDRMHLSHDLPSERLVSRYEAIAAMESTPEIKQFFFDEMFRNFRISYGPRDWGRALQRLENDSPGHPVALKYRPHLDEEMAERDAPDEIRIYKEIDGVRLEAHVFYPSDLAETDHRSAYLFFHGGGWAIGTPEWGYRNCKRMAERGMIAVSFEYRLADVHGTGIFSAVEDVQSAIRWARTDLPIDPDRVVAAGFSAGGHLAAGTAILDIIGPEEPSPRPNALVIHSSSYNLTKGRFFEAMTGGRAKEVSLTHQVESGLVPTILIHGKYDHLAPLSEFEEFVARMEELENDFEHHLFDVGHFFRNEEASQKARELTDAFLVERGFLEPAP